MRVFIQLAIPDVHFNKFETAIFSLQLSLQVGPNETATVERCRHTRLSDPEFGRGMLERLHGCVSRIKENWESNNALWIFTFLTAGLPSITTRDLMEQALGLLIIKNDIEDVLRNAAKERHRDTMQCLRDNRSRGPVVYPIL